ncbi:MAG: response regulator transcription factor, partial [bacterium]
GCCLKDFDMTTRILLAEDHEVVREGLRSLLEKEKDLEIVGEAGDGRTAAQLVREKLPKVILMDITMPDLNGIDASAQILSEFPNMKIIILSMHAEQEYIQRALHAGVRGYMLKDGAYQELVNAIRTVLRGDIYLSPGITGIVVGKYLEKTKTESSAISSLTLREREILQLLAEGLTAKEIATRLNLSTKTIEVHRQRIMDKLDIHNVVQLTRYAIREGLTSP